MYNKRLANKAQKSSLCKATFIFFKKNFDKRILNVALNTQDLIDRARDIYENRVEKLLDSMTSVELYELPTSEPWTLDKFLDKVSTYVITVKHQSF